MKYFLGKFKYAFSGIKHLLLDKSVVIQEVIAVLVLAFFTFVLKANSTQLVIIMIMCALVIVAEMLNTCLEEILNFIEPNYNEKVKVLKDMGAGAVLFVAIIAAVVGCVITWQIIGG